MSKLICVVAFTLLCSCGQDVPPETFELEEAGFTVTSPEGWHRWVRSDIEFERELAKRSARFIPVDSVPRESDMLSFGKVEPHPEESNLQDRKKGTWRGFIVYDRISVNENPKRPSDATRWVFNGERWFSIHYMTYDRGRLTGPSFDDCDFPTEVQMSIESFKIHPSTPQLSVKDQPLVTTGEGQGVSNPNEAR